MKTQEFSEQFKASRKFRRCTDDTMKNYDWVLGRLADVFPDEVPETESEIMEVLNHDTEHLAASSINTIIKRLRVAYTWAMNQGLIECNPSKT